MVFCTTYALILPAITMEPEYVCGIEAHVHSEACYQLPESVPLASLICSSDTVGIHSHTTECYDENGEPRCGIADFVLHTHNTDCCDANGELVCTLPEVEEHVHSESCWQQPHVHEDVCYIRQRGEIVCTLEEGSVHTHQDTCYTQQDNLICTLHETAPHTHTTEACYTETKDLLCTEPEVEAHTHSDSCYTVETTQICSQEEVEGHAHGDGCFAEDGSVICALSEITGHTHTDACFQTATVFSCTLAETAGHTHADDCYSATTLTLTCTAEETEGHTHTPTCHEIVRVVTCTLEENVPHVHTDACFVCTPVLQCAEQTAEDGAVPVLTCEKEELFLHIHEESCFDESGICTCGMLQVAEHIHDDTCFVITQEQPTEPVLACGCEEHEHIETCIPQEETDNTITADQLIAEGYYCGVAEHIHAAENNCFAEDGMLMCTMTEHEHDWICELIPSDPTAIETAEDWETGLPELQGNIAADLIAVAQSQLGYEQSEVNYIIENDEQLFYSRYSDWWSCGEEPYGDWNAQFVTFCLEYAGIPFPTAATPAAWLEEPDLTDYLLPEGELPIPADLVFLTNDRMGIVTAVDAERGKVEVILEWNGKVREKTFDLTEDVLALARIPGNQPAQVEASERVELVIRLINAMPSVEEFDEMLLLYEANDDWDGYESYYAQVYHQALNAYVLYEDLSVPLREQVSNADKLLELQWLWSAQTLDITRGIDVYQVNSYPDGSVAADGSATVLFKGRSPDNYGVSMSFAWWSAIVVEADENGTLYVSKVITTEGVDKSAHGPETENGFVLFIWTGNLPSAQVSASVHEGDIVSVPFDYSKTATYNGNSYGTVTFSDGKFKSNKDNSDKLHIIDSADTDELIEVNLYNYGSNINTLYSKNNKYPGFQQEGGEAYGSNLHASNFGNNVTEDRDAGENGLTNAGGDINKTENGANYPISGAVLETLQNGYPALTDGTSLDYLFSDGTYADKKNTQNINGLFQYNDVTGAYTFNSRENHAQYSNNYFTLYEEIITPNFTMYPFGNFLPFSDIVHDSAQVSTIDRDYLLEIQSSAQYKANAGYDSEFTTATPYATLASSMKTWIGKMDAKYGTNWNLANGANEYFAATAAIPDLDFNQNQTLLNKAYCIDYDEPKNFYFGMEMKMNFMMPKNGMTGNDTNGDGASDYPMVFEFSGDDDVWVYVDGILFLDLSGIHRHVGGTIDFSKGIVTYQALDPATGDVGEPYKTVTFAEILGSSADLKNGTFKDYTQHTFNFYYMERGAGSGVCRMNFNFPLLRKNSINVTKKNTANIDVSGSPDYYFNLMAEENGRTTGLFVGPNSMTGITQYKVMDSTGNIIQEDGQDKIYTVGTDGIFKIKAGQTAVFEGVPENSGKFYVQELIPEADVPQYGGDTDSDAATGDVYVNGTTARYRQLIDWSERTYFSQYDTDGDPETGPLGYRWWGYSGPTADSSANSSFYFEQDNHVDAAALGSLAISKKLVVNKHEEQPMMFKSTKAVEFSFYVTLDGTPIPKGTAYNVGTEARTVEETGYISVPAGQTAVIEHILSGSKYTVKEINEDGYTVTYATTNGSYNSTTQQVEGTIITSDIVEVTVTNSLGAAAVEIPVTKSLPATDGKARDFYFTLQQVVDKADLTPIGTAETVALSLSETDIQKAGAFTLSYADFEITELPSHYYYLITEQLGEDGDVRYDSAVYLAEVMIENGGDGDATATVVGFWKQETSAAWTPCDNMSADFTNTLVGGLTLSKKVLGTTPEGGFTFELTLCDQNGNPVSGTFPAIILQHDGKEIEDNRTFNAEGKHLVEGVMHGESITIHDIPIGTTWTIEETSPDGYVVTYTVNGDEAQSGAISTGDITTGNTEVAYINSAMYELPETGGGGAMAPRLIGSGMLLTLPILYAVKGRYRGRRVKGG